VIRIAPATVPPHHRVHDLQEIDECADPEGQREKVGEADPGEYGRLSASEGQH
jgi:hypothetical protein